MAATLPSLLAVALATSTAAAAHRPPADGKALYREHCAGCHGADGGGDGPVAADLRFKPRAFKEGKFAFGNTVDAMVKTVRSGVPGREVPQMPAFTAVLSDEEVKAVVDYVRTLMPIEAAAATLGMEMVVGDAAKIARGILAPLDEGSPPIARGLLVGLPGGTTFEYALQDDERGFEELHLVAVRRGGFVTRSDWEGRGGRPLTPLGEIVWREPMSSTFGTQVLGGDHAQWMWAPATRRLRSTSVQGAEATIEYLLIAPDGRDLFVIRETPGAVVVSGGAGFRRTFELTPIGAPTPFMWQRVLRNGGEESRLASRESLAQETGWWVTRQPDGSCDCSRIDWTSRSPASAPPEGVVTGQSGKEFDQLSFSLPAAAMPARFVCTTVVRREVSRELLERMTTEVATGSAR